MKDGGACRISFDARVFGRLGIAGRTRWRLLGLFDKRFDGDLLVIAPCRSIHTFGMKSAVDAAFFDRHGVVLAARRVFPWRVFSCRGAEGVIERAVEETELTSRWFEPGDQLCLACMGE
ncbi:MAG: hypothetical protein Q4A43_02775 [Coriobacteriia bacterium]|nr:hypothetical protein [Coriobacteriia bacterium]